MTDTGSLLDQRLDIETPERVVITHDLAGIGSRFAAGTIDACILIIPWVAASCVLLAVMPSSGKLNQEEAQALGMATGGVCYAILWLYFLLFETFGGGRTPGKRFLKLRVMSVHGGPAPASAIVLRNLLRVVDSLPTLFLPFLGGLVMFLNRRSQRIGDLAAGTVVVRERPEALRSVSLRTAVSGSDAYGGPPAAQGGEIAAAHLVEIDRFLARRHELTADARTVIGLRICVRMRERYGLPQGDPEQILGLLGARRTPAQIRDLAGPAQGFAPPPPRAVSPPPPASAPPPSAPPSAPPEASS